MNTGNRICIPWFGWKITFTKKKILHAYLHQDLIPTFPGPELSHPPDKRSTHTVVRYGPASQPHRSVPKNNNRRTIHGQFHPVHPGLPNQTTPEKWVSPMIWQEQVGWSKIRFFGRITLIRGKTTSLSHCVISMIFNCLYFSRFSGVSMSPPVSNNSVCVHEVVSQNIGIRPPPDHL